MKKWLVVLICVVCPLVFTSIASASWTTAGQINTGELVTATHAVIDTPGVYFTGFSINSPAGWSSRQISSQKVVASGPETTDVEATMTFSSPKSMPFSIHVEWYDNGTLLPYDYSAYYSWNGSAWSRSKNSPESTLHFGPNSNSGYASEPVNTALGNYTYEHTDLKLAGNPGLEFRRAYNSQDGYQGPFGYGWTHSYNIFLSVSGSSAKVKYADGHEEQYTVNANGTFTAAFGGTYSTLVKNQDGTYTVQDKTQKVYIFGSDGKLKSIVDKNGNTISLVYTSGNLTSVTDPAGRTLSLTYDSSNHITGITDPVGRTVSYSYDANGNLASYTDANGGKWSYQYDSSHEVTQIVNPLGNVLIANTYIVPKVVSQINGLGNTTTFQYDTPNPGDTTITDPMGKKTIHSHDSQYELIKVVNPLGQTTSYTYDVNGNRTQITDVRGNITQYAYDAMGNVTQKTDTLGDVTSISYDALNNPLTRTDALGHMTVFAYDAKGNLITTKDPLGHTTVMSYTASGEISSITNANGYTSTFSYDSAGDLILAEDPLKNSTTYTYDAVGRKVSATDANGLTTSYAYDENDNLISVTDPNGKTAFFVYDLNNNQASATDKKGVITSYVYDALDEVIQVSSPDRGGTVFIYNPDQAVNTKTDANGITTTYVYDAGGRLTAMTFPDASQNIALSYDASASQTGFLTGMADPSGATAYQYDALGRIVNKTATVLGVTYTTDYQYDKVGNLVSVTYPSGRQVAFTLNAINLPLGVNEVTSSGASHVASGISYDKVGNLLALTFGNGLVMQRGYDAVNRLSQMSVSHVLNLGYLRDPMGNITTLDDLTKVRNFETFSYDALYRLMTAQGPWGNQTYTYDANGNRLFENWNRDAESYVYQGNRLLAISAGHHAESLKYDQNGNITQDGDFNFIYNQSNRLAKVVQDARVVGEYTYNGKGQRVIKKIPGDEDKGWDWNANDTRCIVFHYDLFGRLIEETSVNGRFIRDYVYLGQNPLALVKSKGQKEEIFFYHNDHLGAPKAMTDQWQRIVWTADFDPFGNMASDFDLVKNQLRFPGQYFDKETGLNYNYFRYYNPKTGRYTQADPIGLLGGMNRYVYVVNNPVMMVDPSGLSSQESGGMVLGASTSSAGQQTSFWSTAGSFVGNFFASVGGSLTNDFSTWLQLIGAWGDTSIKTIQYQQRVLTDAVGLLSDGTTKVSDVIAYMSSYFPGMAPDKLRALIIQTAGQMNIQLKPNQLN